MHRLALAAVLALLIAPVTANAKGPTDVEVCDRGTCVDAGPLDHRLLGGVDTPVPIALDEAVRLRVTFGHGGGWANLRFHPGTGSVGNPDGRWYRPDAPTVTALRVAHISSVLQRLLSAT